MSFQVSIKKWYVTKIPLSLDTRNPAFGRLYISVRKQERVLFVMLNQSLTYQNCANGLSVPLRTLKQVAHSNRYENLNVVTQFSPPEYWNVRRLLVYSSMNKCAHVVIKTAVKLAGWREIIETSETCLGNWNSDSITRLSYIFSNAR